VADGIDIGSIDRQARSAGYGDGLLEIFASIVLFVIALSWLGNPGFVGILAALIAIYGWKVVERVKERVVYPRVGYYKERADDAKETSRGMLMFIGGALLLMALAVFAFGDITDASEWRRAAPLLSGLALSGGFWYAGDKSGMLRYRLISAWSVISGVLLWWFGSGASYSGVVWHLVGLAVPLATIGVWSLLIFLRTHPVQDA
jgi:hypothetical protein